MMGSMLRRGAIDSACAATAVPDVPVGTNSGAPSVSVKSSSSLQVDWNPDPSRFTENLADRYEIQRSATSQSGPWTTIAANVNPADLLYVDTGLSDNTKYWYQLRAVNCFGSSAYTTMDISEVTPSATPTAAWTLDFTGTPSGYTLTRASTGTYVDSSGYVASAATDVARLTHNSSGSRLGLLVEEQRTNLLLRSEEFNQAGGWPTLNGVSIGANVTTAPDNTSTADELIEDSATSRHNVVTGSRTVSQSLPYTASCYVKANNRSYCAVTLVGVGGTNARFCQVFDLTGSGALGSTNTQSSPTGTGGTITAVGNGWFRVTATMDSQTSTSMQVVVSASDSATPTFASNAPSYLGAGNSAIYVWGAQLEQGSAASSYIPTTTATVTRSADLAHVLDSSITNWGDPGALVVHFYPPSQAGTLFSTDDAATAQVGIKANSTTTACAFWSSGETSTGTIGSGVQKAVHYWNGSTSKFAINGGTVQSGTNNLTIANTDFVTLGAEATDSAGVPGTFSQYSNCIIRRVEFYSGTLTDAQLQAVTT